MGKYSRGYRRWFKVKIDILDDPKLEECSADCFRFFIRLLAMLKRIDSQDGKIELGRRSLNACAGRHQLRYSVSVASEGAALGLYAFRVEGARFFITVPKWAENQEIKTPQLPKRSTPLRQSRERVERETDGVPGACAPPAAKIVKPEHRPLPEATVAKMIAVKPHGMVHTPAEVQSWFQAKAPLMSLKGRKNLTRTALNWWPRIKPGEVREAIKHLEDIRSRERANEIRAEIKARDEGRPEFSPEEIEEAANALHIIR